MPTVNTKIEQISMDLAGEFEDWEEERKHLLFRHRCRRTISKKARIHDGIDTNPHKLTEEKENETLNKILSKFPLEWQKSLGCVSSEDIEKVQNKLNRKRSRLRF
jgi:hypothetical protein